MVSSPSSFRGAPRQGANPESRSRVRWLDSGFGRRRAPRNDGRKMTKKEPPFPAAFEVDNREASNSVDRSHSVSKQGRSSNGRERLIERKRTVLLKRR